MKIVFALLTQQLNKEAHSQSWASFSLREVPSLSKIMFMAKLTQLCQFADTQWKRFSGTQWQKFMSKNIQVCRGKKFTRKNFQVRRGKKHN